MYFTLIYSVIYILHSLFFILHLKRNGNFSIVCGWFHPIFVEHIDAGATYACGVVVEVEGVAIGLWLQLIGELALG